MGDLPSKFPITFKSFNGQQINIDVKCDWIDKEQKLIGYFFQNITEILGENEISFQEVTEFLPNGVIVMEIEGQFVINYANHEHCKILGVTDIFKEDGTSIALVDYIYGEDKRWVLSDMFECFYQEKNVDMEFRIKDTKGNLKWIRFFGRIMTSATGKQLFYATLKDLSDRRDITDKLHLEKVLFHKVAELAKEILFRVDLKTNVIHFLGQDISNFSIPPVMNNFPNCILGLNRIYEEDIPVFVNMVNDFTNGNDGVVELRLKMRDDQAEWYQIVYSLIKNSDEETILAIGKILNINEHKVMEEKAKIDLLTGFYNKVTTGLTIDKLISVMSDNQYAVFLIDLDHFKEINDNLGHYFGDMVLRETADEIRRCFRDGDIFGRIGGDEFVVAMKYYGDDSVILSRAEQLCSVLRKTYNSEKGDFPISASIGISVYPYDGKNYNELYQRTDEAMYISKARGRNCYTRYVNDFVENNEIKEVDHTLERQNSSIDTKLSEEVMNLDYTLKNIPSSVEEALKYIGRKYKVDRTYFYEKDLETGKLFKLTYLWENSIIIKNTVVTEIKVESIVSLFKQNSKDGIFYTNNLELIEDSELVQVFKEDKVLSVFAMHNLDNTIFFGMDDCHKKNNWTKKDLTTIFYLVNFLFLMLSHSNDYLVELGK